jgi:hypothetical protein
MRGDNSLRLEKDEQDSWLWCLGHHWGFHENSKMSIGQFRELPDRTPPHLF